MKIAIIGYSGSGKSSLAKQLAHHYQLPLLHLDRLHFLPHWKERPDKEMQQLIREFMIQHTTWVIDGNYTHQLYTERMEKANQIIFLNFSRWNCLFRAVKRYIRYHGTVREDMASDCPEKLDREFILWILKDGRTREKRRQYQEICRKYDDKIIILHHQRELDAFLQSLLS